MRWMSQTALHLDNLRDLRPFVWCEHLEFLVNVYCFLKALSCLGKIAELHTNAAKLQKGLGLPVETAHGWEIPEEERGLHASGHACGPDLLMIARRIQPEVLIPVHTEHARFYAERLGGTGIRVTLPTVGGAVEL